MNDATKLVHCLNIMDNEPGRDRLIYLSTFSSVFELTMAAIQVEFFQMCQYYP